MIPRVLEPEIMDTEQDALEYDAAEIKRLLKPLGGILIRDLFRPDTEQQVDEIVKKAELDCSSYQQKLFRDSLCAALTVNEITELVNKVGFENTNIYQSSERHWTIEKNLF